MTLTEFNPAEEYGDAMRNVICQVSGMAKTGKTRFGLGSDGPRYFVSLDRNPTWRLSIMQSIERGYDSPLHPLRFDPLEYVLLTPDEALSRLRKVENFAREARNIGKGGTFFLDGGTIFMGYIERAYLGESLTLGYRPGKGSSPPRREQYSVRNGYVADFLAGFVGSDLDVVISFEGRFYDHYKSSAPKAIDFIATLPVEVAMVINDVPNGVGGVNKEYSYAMVFGPNPYIPEAAGYAMPAKDFKGVKNLLKQGVPDLSKLIHESELQRANTSVFEEIVDEGAGTPVANPD